MKFYLRMEGVNLANFVNDTQDLSTVRGGSLLLLKAVHDVKQAPSVPLEAVTTGASAGLFRFEAVDDATANSVREEVVKRLQEDPQVMHATFVVDVQRASTDFVHDREALLARNRWQQMCQPTGAIPMWNAHGMKVCEIDRVRPAPYTMHGPEKTEWVSASVKTRREFGRQQKQQFYEQHTGVAIRRDFAQDLNELTSDPTRGNLHHKMAVIYLDGNGFGKLQNAQCTTPDAQRQFDEKVKVYRRDLLTALLQSMERDEQPWLSQRLRYRLETLLWGGDEIIWVVPAWQGWKTLALFYQQSSSWAFADHRLTHAAGMVFCHHNAPIHRITALARNLADLAKTKSRDDNLFAYQVLESFDHVGRDLREFLTGRYGAAEALVLSGDSMATVEENFTQLKRQESFPRRKLHQIVHQLRQNLTQAEHIIAQVTHDHLQGWSWAISPALAEYIIAQVTHEPRLTEGGELKTLREYFGTNPTGWFHLAELWDYVGS